ncbi:MAG TPA: tRNA (adenosine(37)-N6)-threonylcarbamoyltransferase complex dimerization subunit type 1 TsaB [Caulifigura sp.]|nr:tRNA (adenosine(37)-N6)-threonylcarbamoyltransferase complex dimerization subunit type 1 TsaB [Caulifigura sp.]
MAFPQYTVGLETSGQIGSIAILQGDELLAERSLGESGRRHARSLISELDDLLKSHSIAPRAVEHVAVSVGPGSFTGLRVGVVATKLWGYATGARLTAVGTFEAIAAALPVDARGAWIIDDALRGEVFVQRFDVDGKRWRPSGDVRIAGLDAWLSETAPADLVAGPAAAKWPDDLDRARLAVVVPEFHRPTAEFVARCGLEKAAAGNFADPFQLSPLYIRRSAAEEKLDAQPATGPSR